MTTTPTTVHLPSDPAARLAMLEDALHQLLMGQTKVQIRHGDYWVEYGAGNATMLKAEVARLRALVHQRTGIIIGRTPCG